MRGKCWAAAVPKGAAPQRPTELPRPRLPTESVGRSALGRSSRLFTPQKRQSQRAAGADFEAKPDENQPFHAIFRSKIACGAP